MPFGTASIGFGPADNAQYAAEAAPILGARRVARIGTKSVCSFAVVALCLSLSCLLGSLQYFHYIKHLIS